MTNDAEEQTSGDTTICGELLTCSGKVNIEYCSNGECVGNLYFTPDKEHTIDHLRKKYVVFVADHTPDQPIPLRGTLFELKDNCLTIKVNKSASNPMVRELALVATKSVGVDIGVKIEGEGLCLEKAVVPAQSHSR